MLINDSRELFTPHNRITLTETPIVVTDSFKTPENIGNLIRIAANIGIKKIICIEEIPLKESKIKKTACMAWDYVELIRTNPIDFRAHIPAGYINIALETTQESVNIYDTKLPAKMALFLGNEIKGIRPEILADCPIHVNIPMTGLATSMNVSHAAAAALFEWLRQHLP